MRNMVLGQDSTFTLDSFIKRYNADLANDYGNVVNRVLVLISKYFDSKIPSPGDYNETDLNLIVQSKELPIKVENYINQLKIHEAVEIIFSLIRSINKYLEDKEPWKTIKEFQNQNEITATTLYVSIECIRISTSLLSSIMPSKTKIVLEAIGMNKLENIDLSYGKIKPGQKIKLPKALFPKKDT